MKTEPAPVRRRLVEFLLRKEKFQNLRFRFTAQDFHWRVGSVELQIQALKASVQYGRLADASRRNALAVRRQFVFLTLSAPGLHDDN